MSHRLIQSGRRWARRGACVLIGGILAAASVAASDGREGAAAEGVRFSEWSAWEAAHGDFRGGEGDYKVGSFVVREVEAAFWGGVGDEAEVRRGVGEEAAGDVRGVVGAHVGKFAEGVAAAVRGRARGDALGALGVDGAAAGDFRAFLRGRGEAALVELGDALVRYGVETAVTDVLDVARLGMVETVEWDLHSDLGGRDWHGGMSALGALHKGADRALLWQLRGFAARGSGAGANVGLIYRTVESGNLAGVNAFVDVERDRRYGQLFSRWSVGGEYRREFVRGHANVYRVMTEGRRQADGVWAYSRSGYDFEMSFSGREFEKWTKLRGLEGGLTYYNFGGEFGDADDKGLRYFVQTDDIVEPLTRGFWDSDVRFRFEVDVPSDGDAKVGWMLHYAHAFGAPPGGGAAGAGRGNYDPRTDLYAPARRDHKQRISYAAPSAPLAALVVSVTVGAPNHAAWLPAAVGGVMVLSGTVTEVSPAGLFDVVDDVLRVTARLGEAGVNGVVLVTVTAPGATVVATVWGLAVARVGDLTAGEGVTVRHFVGVDGDGGGEEVVVTVDGSGMLVGGGGSVGSVGNREGFPFVARSPGRSGMMAAPARGVSLFYGGSSTVGVRVEGGARVRFDAAGYDATVLAVAVLDGAVRDGGRVVDCGLVAPGERITVGGSVVVYAECENPVVDSTVTVSVGFVPNAAEWLPVDIGSVTAVGVGAMVRVTPDDRFDVVGGMLRVVAPLVAVENRGGEVVFEVVVDAVDSANAVTMGGTVRGLAVARVGGLADGGGVNVVHHGDGVGGRVVAVTRSGSNLVGGGVSAASSDGFPFVPRLPGVGATMALPVDAELVWGGDEVVAGSGGARVRFDAAGYDETMLSVAVLSGAVEVGVNRVDCAMADPVPRGVGGITVYADCDRPAVDVGALFTVDYVPNHSAWLPVTIGSVTYAGVGVMVSVAPAAQFTVTGGMLVLTAVLGVGSVPFTVFVGNGADMAMMAGAVRGLAVARVGGLADGGTVTVVHFGDGADGGVGRAIVVSEDGSGMLAGGGVGSVDNAEGFPFVPRWSGVDGRLTLPGGANLLWGDDSVRAFGGARVVIDQAGFGEVGLRVGVLSGAVGVVGGDRMGCGAEVPADAPAEVVVGRIVLYDACEGPQVNLDAMFDSVEFVPNVREWLPVSGDIGTASASGRSVTLSVTPGDRLAVVGGVLRVTAVLGGDENRGVLVSFSVVATNFADGDISVGMVRGLAVARVGGLGGVDAVTLVHFGNGASGSDIVVSESGSNLVGGGVTAVVAVGFPFVPRLPMASATLAMPDGADLIWGGAASVRAHGAGVSVRFDAAGYDVDVLSVGVLNGIVTVMGDGRDVDCWHVGPVAVTVGGGGGIVAYPACVNPVMVGLNASPFDSVEFVPNAAEWLPVSGGVGTAAAVGKGAVLEVAPADKFAVVDGTLRVRAVLGGGVPFTVRASGGGMTVAVTGTVRGLAVARVGGVGIGGTVTVVHFGDGASGSDIVVSEGGGNLVGGGVSAAGSDGFPFVPRLPGVGATMALPSGAELVWGGDGVVAGSGGARVRFDAAGRFDETVLSVAVLSGAVEVGGNRVDCAMADPVPRGVGGITVYADCERPAVDVGARFTVDYVPNHSAWLPVTIGSVTYAGVGAMVSVAPAAQFTVTGGMLVLTAPLGVGSVPFTVFVGNGADMTMMAGTVRGLAVARVGDLAAGEGVAVVHFGDGASGGDIVVSESSDLLTGDGVGARAGAVANAEGFPFVPRLPGRSGMMAVPAGGASLFYGSSSAVGVRAEGGARVRFDAAGYDVTVLAVAVLDGAVGGVDCGVPEPAGVTVGNIVVYDACEEPQVELSASFDSVEFVPNVAEWLPVSGDIGTAAASGRGVTLSVTPGDRLAVEEGVLRVTAVLGGVENRGVLVPFSVVATNFADGDISVGMVRGLAVARVGGLADGGGVDVVHHGDGVGGRVVAVTRNGEDLTGGGVTAVVAEGFPFVPRLPGVSATLAMPANAGLWWGAASVRAHGAGVRVRFDEAEFDEAVLSVGVLGGVVTVVGMNRVVDCPVVSPVIVTVGDIRVYDACEDDVVRNLNVSVTVRYVPNHVEWLGVVGSVVLDARNDVTVRVIPENRFTVDARGELWVTAPLGDEDVNLNVTFTVMANAGGITHSMVAGVVTGVAVARVANLESGNSVTVVHYGADGGRNSVVVTEDGSGMLTGDGVGAAIRVANSAGFPFVPRLPGMAATLALSDNAELFYGADMVRADGVARVRVDEAAFGVVSLSVALLTGVVEVGSERVDCAAVEPESQAAGKITVYAYCDVVSVGFVGPASDVLVPTSSSDSRFDWRYSAGSFLGFVVFTLSVVGASRESYGYSLVAIGDPTADGGIPIRVLQEGDYSGNLNDAVNGQIWLERVGTTKYWEFKVWLNSGTMDYEIRINIYRKEDGVVKDGVVGTDLLPDMRHQIGGG